MSRFTRFSCISPLELCLEAERRAWRCAAFLLVLLLAVAAGALWLPSSAVDAGGDGDTRFSGFVVEGGEQAEEPGEAVREFPAPPLPEVELLPELLCTPAPPEPEMTSAVAWKVMELEDPAPFVLALELPESLSVLRRATASPPARGRAAAGGAEVAAGEFLPASYRSAPRPPYPPSLLNRRVQGRVGLRITVGPDGQPQKVEVSAPSGCRALDQAAREWVLAHWRFHPARRGGVAVSSVVRTQVEFVLR